MRGPRSRAGFRAAPVFIPRDEAMARTTKNIPTGTTPGGAGPLFLSVNMRIPVISIAAPKNYTVVSMHSIELVTYGLTSVKKAETDVR